MDASKKGQSAQEEGGKFGTSQIMPATQKRAATGLHTVEFSGDFTSYDLETFGNELIQKSEQADSDAVQAMLEAALNCNQKLMK